MRLFLNVTRLCFTAMKDRAPLAGPFLAALALSVLSGCAHRTSSTKSGANVPAPPRPARIGATEEGVASWYGYPYHGRATASGEIYDMEELTAAHRTLAFQTWLEVTNLANGKRVEVRVTDRGPFVHGRIVDLSLAAARQIDMVRSGTARVRLKVIRPPEKLPAAESSVAESSAAKTPVAQDVAEPRIDSTTPALPSVPPATTSPSAPSSATTPAWDIRDDGLNAGHDTVRYTVQAGAFADESRAEALLDTLVARLPESASAQAPRVWLFEVAGTSTPWHVLAGSGLSFEQVSALAPEVRKVAGAALVIRDPSPRDTIAPSASAPDPPRP